MNDYYKLFIKLYERILNEEEIYQIIDMVKNSKEEYQSKYSYDVLMNSSLLQRNDFTVSDIMSILSVITNAKDEKEAMQCYEMLTETDLLEKEELTASNIAKIIKVVSRVASTIEKAKKEVIDKTESIREKKISLKELSIIISNMLNKEETKMSEVKEPIKVKVRVKKKNKNQE